MAVVFELLSVDWYLSLVNANDPTSSDWGFLSTNTTRATTELSTLATAAEDAVDPLTFGMAFSHRGVSASGGNVWHMPAHIDLSDGEGNGMLIATDNIFVVGGNVGGAGGGAYTCKMTYRLTEVGIQEFVGIVQSQQA